MSKSTDERPLAKVISITKATDKSVEEDTPTDPLLKDWETVAKERADKQAAARREANRKLKQQLKPRDYK